MCKICVLKRPMIIVPNNGKRAVSQKGAYWKNGDTLDIYVYSAARRYLDDIRFAYEHWLRNTSLKVNFDVAKKDSDIRIDFKPGGGSWSYVGTDALMIRKTDPTMSLGWEGLDVIYHEVGHSLGLLHEHQNPDVGIKWNAKVVKKELSGPPNNWDLASINSNVLRAVNPSTVNYTSFDRDSVMLYFFPDSWTLDGKGTKENPEPSLIDLEHVRKLYPEPNELKDYLTHLPNLAHLHKEHIIYTLERLGVEYDVRQTKKALLAILMKRISIN